MQRRISLFVLALAAAAVAASAASAGSRDLGAPDHVTIAYQPGVGYTPLIVLKAQRTIETQFPGTRVEWKVLSSGAAITNGVIAGQIDIGAGGVGPLLTGWAQGVNWKLLTPLNYGDLWLMAKDPSIKTVADLKGKRIALPSPTSIQAVILRRMAEAKLGDAHALDSGMVSMDHPDAMQALIAGQIDAHLTSAPLQFQEKVRGAHVVARSYQYFGAHTFLGVFATQKFYDDHTAFAKKLFQDILQAESLIKSNPLEVSRILQHDAGGLPTWRQFKQWLASPALTWTTRPLGLMRFANFMNRTNQLSKMPSSWKDLVFPTVYATKGS
jgi:NitT/TauT family transport system substrate-binding protein